MLNPLELSGYCCIIINVAGDTMLCLNCLRNDLKDTDTCGCGSKNLVKKRGGKYLFNGQVFSEKRWLAFLANQNRYKINPLYLEEKLNKNMRMHTFTRLLLPSLFFFILSLGASAFLFVTKEKMKIHQNSIAVTVFIALFLFVVAIINLKRIIFDHIRVIAKLRNGKITYQQIKQKSIEAK